MQTRKRVLTIVIVGIVAGVFVIATAAGAEAAALKPPVIKEVFTPLTCTNDDTTLGMEGCAEQQILRTDKTIDSLNAKIFTKLSAGAKKDFISGHDAWLKYRTAYCLSESDVYQGGSEAGVINAQCTGSISATHAQELRRFLSSLDRP